MDPLLLVEDDPRARATLARLLGRDLPVEEASDVGSALARIGSRRYAGIASD